MLLLNKDEIQEVFSMKEAVQADKDAYQLFSDGKCDIPLRTQLPAPEKNGVFLFMPAYCADMECAILKDVNIFPENAKEGLPTAPAMVLLADGNTGMISAAMDGTYVTALRTGASSGAFFDEFAIKNAKIGCMFGTGSQAEEQLRAMLTVRDLERVYVYSRTPENRTAFVERMQGMAKDFGVEILAADCPKQAVSDADVVIAVTSSTEPVFNADWVKPGAALSFIGAYRPEMHEIPPELLKRAGKIYFDSKEAVLEEAGDIITPLKDGTVTMDDFTGDFGDYISGRLPGRESDDEIIVFKSVGIGIQDLVAAKRIYDKAVEKNMGTKWDA